MEERANNMPVSKADLRKLLTDLDHQTGLHSMMNVVLCSGMSVDDALNIHLSDIDYASDKIILFDKYLGRRREIPLPERVMSLIHKHQNGHEAPKLRLYDVAEWTVNNRLYEHSQAKLGKPIAWSALRRTWALLAFEQDISLKSMMETSGASAQQLAVWSLYKKEIAGNRSGLDLLAEFYK